VSPRGPSTGGQSSKYGSGRQGARNFKSGRHHIFLNFALLDAITCKTGGPREAREPNTEGYDQDIAASVGVGGSKVYRTKRRFVEGNLELEARIYA
jgi:hypothetical protein